MFGSILPDSCEKQKLTDVVEFQEDSKLVLTHLFFKERGDV